MNRLAIFAAALLVLMTACSGSKIGELERQNRELTKKLEGLQRSVPLEQQERCAKQARVEFNAQGFGDKDGAGFVNHYNTKLGKCFVEVTNTSMMKHNGKFVPTTYRFVNDAFEGKIYAEYFWQNSEGKQYWEVAPFVCKVKNDEGEDVFCKTTGEYERLIKEYMEQ